MIAVLQSERSKILKSNGLLAPTNNTATTANTIKNNTTTTAIDVYPNPAIDHVNIAFSRAGKGETTIRITGVTGNTKIEQTINHLSDPRVESVSLDLTKLPDGIYAVEIIQNLKRTVKKIVKIRE